MTLDELHDEFELTRKLLIDAKRTQNSIFACLSHDPDDDECTSKFMEVSEIFGIMRVSMDDVRRRIRHAYEV